MRNRFRRRKKVLIGVVIVVVLTGAWYGYLSYKAKQINLISFAEEVVAMALSALISTGLAIWLTRNDILIDDFSQKKAKFGLIAIENGYKNFFTNEDCLAYLKIQSWEEFFCKINKEKKIEIVGIALNGFFADERASLISKLLLLCIKENYKVSIIVGNPYGEEIKIQSRGQKKVTENHIAESTLNTYSAFKSAIAELDRKYYADVLKCDKLPSEILKEKFSFRFSESLPKAFIARSGKYMIITPYQMKSEGPSVAPTLVVKEADSEGFFTEYENYIERLNDMSCGYELLRKNSALNLFFNQPYGSDLSPEFYNDLQQCNSLSILGLGQNRMITYLEDQLFNIVQRGGKITAILAKPDGESTNMCVARSIMHNNVSDAIIEHKRAINILLSIRDHSTKDNLSNVKVFTWDCFFPYTMYGFDIENPDKCKIYIWMTNLFAYANERDGFLIDGKFEQAYAKKYIRQYNQVMKAAIRDKGEVTTPFIL